MQDELIEILQRLLRDVQLANLTRAFMARVRTITESDEETLIRVMKEYKAAKYGGIPIPGRRDR